MSAAYTAIASALVTEVTAAVGIANWKITKGRPASYLPPHIAVFANLSLLPTLAGEVVEENETWTIRIITKSSDEAEEQDDAMVALRAIIDRWYDLKDTATLSDVVQLCYPVGWASVEFDAGDAKYPGFDLQMRVVDKYTTSY